MSAPQFPDSFVDDPKRELVDVLFRSESFLVFDYGLPLGSPLWGEDQPLTFHSVLLPRAPVVMEVEGGRPTVIDAQVGMCGEAGLLHRECPIRRARSDSLLVAMAPELRSQLFPEPLIYLRMSAGTRKIAAALQNRDSVRAADSLALEEAVMRMLAGLSSLHGDIPHRRATAARHRDLVFAVCEQIARTYSRSHSLKELARLVHSSPFYLARVFRQQTGLSIHGYRDGIRVRTGLSRLAAGASDLSRLALELGYSSHAHFSERFRRHFGCNPSEARKHLRGESPLRWAIDQPA